MSSSAIVQKLWNYCNVLRDDGMSYGDYVEQLTYLLFLKMADERTKAPYNQKNPVPEKYSWPSFTPTLGRSRHPCLSRHSHVPVQHPHLFFRGKEIIL